MQEQELFHRLICDGFGYVVKNNLCLFQKGILSQWWGGFKAQDGGGFKIPNYRIAKLIPYVALRGQTMESGHIYDFNCCEQWMMAVKALYFNDWDSFVKIMATSSPEEQKDLGRAVKGYNDEEWNKVKYDIVLLGNLEKFNQNKSSREFLLGFNKHTMFAEAAPWDSVWGIGLGPDNTDALDINKWKGENLLGEVIREVRRSI
jgi:ribA/ribD-fused uncharacterized protein